MDASKKKGSPLAENGLTKKKKIEEEASGSIDTVSHPPVDQEDEAGPSGFFREMPGGISDRIVSKVDNCDGFGSKRWYNSWSSLDDSDDETFGFNEVLGSNGIGTGTAPEGASNTGYEEDDGVATGTAPEEASNTEHEEDVVRGEAGVSFPFHLLPDHVVKKIIGYSSGGTGSKDLVALSSTCSFFRDQMRGHLRFVMTGQNYYDKDPFFVNEEAYSHIGGNDSEVTRMNLDAWFGLSFLNSDSLSLDGCRIHEGTLRDLLFRMPNLHQVSMVNNRVHSLKPSDRPLGEFFAAGFNLLRVLDLRNVGTRVVKIFLAASSLQHLTLTGSSVNAHTAHMFLAQNANTLQSFNGVDYQVPDQVQFPVLQKLELMRVVDAAFGYFSIAPQLVELTLRNVVMFDLNEFLQQGSGSLERLTLTTSLARFPRGPSTIDLFVPTFPSLVMVHIINYGQVEPSDTVYFKAA